MKIKFDHFFSTLFGVVFVAGIVFGMLIRGENLRWWNAAQTMLVTIGFLHLLELSQWIWRRINAHAHEIYMINKKRVTREEWIKALKNDNNDITVGH